MSWGTEVDFGSRYDWDAYNKNTCREIVEVPGGPDWKIRRLCESAPQFCWRFIDATIVAQYYFDHLAARSSDVIQERQSLTTIPTFYATLPHFVSPFELSIQPKFLDKVRERLTESLVNYYSSHDDVVFEDEQRFESVPCVVPEGEKWFRGRITKITAEYSEVRLVDYGLDRICRTADLRPLVSQFARVPPLALKCRVKDVFINDLDTAKVNKFKNLVAECKNLIRVEVCSNEEPFFVNIYHPTLMEENLGKHFYRPEDHKERELAKQRKWLEHVRREECENDSDFDDEDDEDYDEDAEGDYEPFYIKSFDRSPKFPRGVSDPMVVSNVENSTLIYVQAKWMVSARKKIESALSEGWDSLPFFPTVSVPSGTACAVRTRIGTHHRAVIESTDENKATVLLVDYGSYATVPLDSLRPVLYEDPFFQQPMVYAVSLERGFNYFPHPSETKLLRELIPEGSEVIFDAIKSKNNRIPIHGTIFSSSGDNVTELLSSSLLSNRVDVACREVLPFSPKSVPHPPLDSSFVHRLQCPSVFVKGTLSQCTLSQF